jgi:hypothetical protein
MQSDSSEKSQERDAIVAVCDDGQIVIISLITKSETVRNILQIDEDLGNYLKQDLPVGLYFAHCDITMWGEYEYDHEWIIGDPIYVMSPDYLESLKRGQ